VPGASARRELLPRGALAPGAQVAPAKVSFRVHSRAFEPCLAVEILANSLGVFSEMAAAVPPLKIR
jgi:hypothetical protein